MKHGCVLLLFVFLMASAPARAGTRVSIASDVTPWFLKGYSVVAMLELERLSHLRWSFEVWGMNMPTFLTDLTNDNKGEGWSRRVLFALAAYGDYHLHGDGTGWHFGGAGNFMRSRVARAGHSGAGEFWTLEVFGRAGYLWMPFDGIGLFVNPWAGLAVLIPLQPMPSVAGEPFAESAFNGFATMHLGWRF